jgi:hypothetical protein
MVSANVDIISWSSVMRREGSSTVEQRYLDTPAASAYLKALGVKAAPSDGTSRRLQRRPNRDRHLPD